MEKNRLCDYGCGRIAIFQMTSGKWCCESFYTKCPEFIKKMVRSNTGQKRSKEFGIFISKLHKNKVVGKEQKEKQRNKMKDLRNNPDSIYNTDKYKIKNKTCNIGRKKSQEFCEKIREKLTGRKLPKLLYYIKNFPEFFDHEFIEEDLVTKDLIVKCKICGIKFIVSTYKIQYRLYMIKNGKLHRGCFYCSIGCKEGANYKTNIQFRIYKKRVDRETAKSIRENSHRIKDFSFRSREFHLDHKFSIKEGFKNNIDPRIIGHWKNLEVIHWLENEKKFDRCSIEINKLLQEINQETN
jgi:hypothetical protein